MTDAMAGIEPGPKRVAALYRHAANTWPHGRVTFAGQVRGVEEEDSGEVEPTRATPAGWLLAAHLDQLRASRIGSFELEMGEGSEWPEPGEEHPLVWIPHTGEAEPMTPGHAERVMGELLGLMGDQRSAEWAARHPREWGNGEGKNLHTSPRAYGAGRIGIYDLATHWAGVAERYVSPWTEGDREDG